MTMEDGFYLWFTKVKASNSQNDISFDLPTIVKLCQYFLKLKTL